MRAGSEKRGRQGRSIEEAARTLGASKVSISPRGQPAKDASAEDELTRLVRMIARQAAQEAFSVFRAVEGPPLLDRSTREQAQIAHAGNEPGAPDLGERFLSIADVAKRLGVSEKTVRRKISSGNWPAHRIGRLVRISERVLAAYVVSSNSKA